MTTPVNDRSKGPEGAGDAPAASGTGPAARAAGAGGLTIRLPRPGGRDPVVVWFPPVTSPVAQGALALGIFLAVWVIGFALPLVAHPGIPQLFQQGNDPNFFTWSLRWWPYAIAHGLNPLHSSQIGAPAGYDLSWTTTVPLLAVLATPLTLASGPVVALNLLVAAAPPLSAWAAFVACRRLTGRFWPALAGGTCYGFSAYEIYHTRAGQLNLSWSLLLPLIVYLVLLWRDGKLSKPWLVGLLALAMFGQLFLFAETFFVMTVALGIGLAVGLVLAGRAGRPAVVQLAGLFGAAYLAVIVVASPYLYYMLTHEPHGFDMSHASYDLDLAGLVTPRPDRTFGLTWLHSFASDSVNFHSQGSYIGIPALVLIAALALWRWRNRLARFLVVMFVLAVALSVGTNLIVANDKLTRLPWAGFWSLPLFRSALPDRFVVLAALAAALMVALWLATPARRRWLDIGRWALGLLAVAAVLVNVEPATAYTSPNYQVPKFISAGQYQRFLRPGEVILVLSTRGNAGMLFQAQTGFYMRLAGGYINMAITPRTDLPKQVQALAHLSSSSSRTAIQFKWFLKNAGVRAIIIEKSRAPLWASTLWYKLSMPGRQLGGVIFVPVRRCVIGCAPAQQQSTPSSSG
jgi:hypothetical protein